MYMYVCMYMYMYVCVCAGNLNPKNLGYHSKDCDNWHNSHYMYNSNSTLYSHVNVWAHTSVGTGKFKCFVGLQLHQMFTVQP